jgi:hypothetical protein
MVFLTVNLLNSYFEVTLMQVKQSQATLTPDEHYKQQKRNFTSNLLNIEYSISIGEDIGDAVKAAESEDFLETELSFVSQGEQQLWDGRENYIVSFMIDQAYTCFQANPNNRDRVKQSLANIYTVIFECNDQLISLDENYTANTFWPIEMKFMECYIHLNGMTMEELKETEELLPDSDVKYGFSELRKDVMPDYV